MFKRNKYFEKEGTINFQGKSYEAAKCIQNGGYGVVFRYREPNTSDTIIVKFLHSSKITEKNTNELSNAATLWQELGYESEVKYVIRQNGASIPILIMPDVGKKNALVQLKETMRDDIPIEMKYREVLKTIHDSIELCIDFDRRGYNHQDATLDNIVYDRHGKACFVDLESIEKRVIAVTSEWAI